MNKYFFAGINLPSANVTIVFEHDWNPHCDFQAIGRMYRIGQKNQTRVYRLVVDSSADEYIRQTADMKSKLSRHTLNETRDNEYIGTGEEEEKQQQQTQVKVNDNPAIDIEDLLAGAANTENSIENDAVFDYDLFQKNRKRQQITITRKTQVGHILSRLMSKCFTHFDGTDYGRKRDIFDVHPVENVITDRLRPRRKLVQYHEGAPPKVVDIYAAESHRSETDSDDSDSEPEPVLGKRTEAGTDNFDYKKYTKNFAKHIKRRSFRYKESSTAKDPDFRINSSSSDENENSASEVSDNESSNEVVAPKVSTHTHTTHSGNE